MVHFFSWYIVITLTGWLAFPLAYRLMPALADRGYAVSRALGLLLWGYFSWFLASLGILQFNTGSIVLTLGIVLGLSLWSIKSSYSQLLKEWIFDQWRYILIIEILFFISFASWSLIRAANPEAMGTEKPMELAFINAILNSPNFPPHDPWLSGYAISYYYFGYVLVSLLAKITQTSAGVAFNLGSALIFALSATGSYGLVYNLLKAEHERAVTSGKTFQQIHAASSALIAPLFLLIVSNLEGFLHSLHTQGLFWNKNTSGTLTSHFWQWLDIKDLNLPPTEPFAWQPTQFWWWWRASRVVQDYDLAGAPREIINEFPFFSFLLADLHPHVLTLPFALLALTVALNMIRGGASGQFQWLKVKRIDINLVSFLFIILILGGIAFLNTWDLPAHLLLVSISYTIPIYWTRKKNLSSTLADFGWFSFLTVLSSIAIYLPFYLGFASQAGGILPNLIYPTRGVHLWVMFAPFLIPMFAYLIVLTKWSNAYRWIKKGLFTTIGLILSLFLFALSLGYLITLIPEAKDIYLGSLSAPDYSSLFQAAFKRRYENPGGWITLAILLSLNLGLLFKFSLKETKQSNMNSETILQAEGHKPAQVYLLVVMAIGALLVIAPEFVYLRDQFGWRMNTIFKFYFQAWLFWSIAASFATIYLITQTKGLWKIMTGLLTGILVLTSLFYPIFSLYSKTNGFKPGSWTLDGTDYLRSQSPDEMSAIDWLQSAPAGVIAEAVPASGGSYSQYARVSMLSGKPAVLGWMGHESQWRGGYEAMGSRQSDLERLYCSSSWEETQSILEQYDIRYVFMGGLERATYTPKAGTCPTGISENKFSQNLSLVYEGTQTQIYEYIHPGTGQ